MIRINALYVLLLIELAVILAVATVYLLLRGRKSANLYRTTVKELSRVQQEQEELRKELAESQAAVQQAAAERPTASAGSSTESDNSEKTVLEENLKEKTRLLNELQVKFDDLEKEYLILYRQQQAQDQEKK